MFPAEERFGLKSQFQRAAVSIPANIAEGYRRIGRADKLHFFNIAQGSLEESRCYIHLSKDVGYLSVETCRLLYSSLEEASKMLNWYCKGIGTTLTKKTLPIRRMQASPFRHHSRNSSLLPMLAAEVRIAFVL